MTFTSLTFWVLLLVAFSVAASPLSHRVRKSALLVLSYVFYAAWNPPFVLLLWASTAVDFFCAQAMQARPKAQRRPYLMLSLAMNLGALAVFKYANFFFETVANLGVADSVTAFDVVLPVGISFYTFQTLSYTLDVYRGERTATRSALDFALYVAFFPQLVAGPIVRAGTFLQQLQDATRRPTLKRASVALTFIVIGLFEKVALADGWLAPVSETVFGAASVVRGADAWIGTLAFSAQIFFDFAGYSTIAIGVAHLLGIDLPDNFRFPYAARGLSDFWRRWHITLSSWLRDYLYISMGGNRGTQLRTALNLMVTMLLGGLWHGAGWTFLLWGALHGSYLLVERGLRRTFPVRVPVALVQAVTLLVVVLAWVPFRAASIAEAGSMYFGLLTPAALELVTPADATVVLCVFFALVLTHHVMRERTLSAIVAGIPSPVLGALLAALLVLTLWTGGVDRAFIYFQF